MCDLSKAASAPTGKGKARSATGTLRLTRTEAETLRGAVERVIAASEEAQPETAPGPPRKKAPRH